VKGQILHEEEEMFQQSEALKEATDKKEQEGTKDRVDEGKNF
jgi:hypothetical protein